MKIEQVTKKIILVKCDTQEELAKMFLRFQEHYESPKFRGKIFTLGEYRDWYAQENGAFTYYKDWNGFNIPSHIFKPFYRGLFDPLSKAETKLLNLFKDRIDEFYVIGVHGEDDNSLEHEICHGLYYTEPGYKGEVDDVIRLYPFAELFIWVKKQGYHTDVIEDEIHAYISADREWLEKEHGIKIEEHIQQELQAIKKKYLRRVK